MNATKFALLLTTLFAGALQAAPCVESSLDTYQRLGGSGCSIGIFTFKNFDFVIEDVSTGILPIAASDIRVIPQLEARRLILTFESDRFNLAGPEFGIYRIDYSIDPPPPIIHGLEDDMGVNSPVAPGFATLDTALCIGAEFGDIAGCADTASVGVFHRGGNDFDLTNAVFFEPVNVLGVSNRFELNGGGTGSSQFNSFGNRILLTPEPGSLILAAAGLAALLAGRSRFKLR